MKMLEDLEEVVRLRDAAEYAAVALSSEEFAEADKAYSDKAAIYIATHHATIRDMAARLEAAESDSKRLDWVESYAHALDWDEHVPMRRVIRADDGCEFCGDTWREQIDAAMQETGR